MCLCVSCRVGGVGGDALSFIYLNRVKLVGAQVSVLLFEGPMPKPLSLKGGMARRGAGDSGEGRGCCAWCC